MLVFDDFDDDDGRITRVKEQAESAELPPLFGCDSVGNLVNSFTSIRHHPIPPAFHPIIEMDTSAPAIFPHETLELIFSFCDVPTLAAVGRVDSACLELSAPFLYEHIEITDEETYKLLFCESTVSPPCID